MRLRDTITGCRRAALATTILMAVTAVATAGDSDGAWRGADGQWVLDLVVRGQNAWGQATYGRFSWAIKATLDAGGAVRGALIPSGQMLQERTLSGRFPTVSISAGNAWSSGGTVVLTRVP
jgi:hypothetical protein